MIEVRNTIKENKFHGFEKEVFLKIMGLNSKVIYLFFLLIL